MAEEPSLEKEAIYRAVFDNAAIGIDLADRNGRFVEANAAIANMLGYTREELLALTVIDVSHPDDVESSGERFEKLIRGDIDSYRVLKRFVRNDGTILWGDLSVSALRGVGGEKVAAMAVIADVTERIRAEEAVVQSEQKYRTLFEESLDPAFVVDFDGTLLEANQALLDLFGHTREELIGQSVLKTYADPADREHYRSEINSRGFVKDYPLKLRTKDGREIDCLFSASVQRDKERNIVGHRGFIRDITAQKALERQLVQAQKNGGRRHVGRRRGPRFQQPAPSNIGIFGIAPHRPRHSAPLAKRPE